MFIKFVTILIRFYLLAFWLWVPRPGIEQAPLALEDEVFITERPGKSPGIYFWGIFFCCLSKQTLWCKIPQLCAFPGNPAHFFCCPHVLSAWMKRLTSLLFVLFLNNFFPVLAAYNILKSFLVEKEKEKNFHFAGISAYNRVSLISRYFTTGKFFIYLILLCSHFSNFSLRSINELCLHAPSSILLKYNLFHTLTFSPGSEVDKPRPIFKWLGS